MKRSFLLLMLLVCVICFVGCKNVKNNSFDSPEQAFQEFGLNNKFVDENGKSFRYPLYYIDSIKGNFIESNNIQMLVLYSDENNSDQNCLYFSDVYIIELNDDNSIIHSYILPDFGPFFETDNNKEIFNNTNYKNELWNYILITDFNNNNLDEIIVYTQTGWCFYPSIYEFHDNKMKKVLDIYDKLSEDSTLIIEKFNKDSSEIHIKGNYDKSFVHKWDKNSCIYELCE